MIKLLRANFSRMFRSWYFCLGMLISVGLSLYIPITNYIGMQSHPEYYTLEQASGSVNVDYIRQVASHESYMFTVGLYCMFIIPVLIALFIGTDYSDGTIRNKIMVGHRRCNIYLANLITAVIGSEIVLLSGMASSYLAGLIFYKYTYLTAAEIFVFILVSVFVTASLAAICTFIVMSIHSKAGGSIVAVMTSFVLMVSATAVISELQMPSYFTYENTETGEMVDLDFPLEEMTFEDLEVAGISSSDMDNLQFVSVEDQYAVTGVKRKIFKWIRKATPGAQYMMLSEWNNDFNKTSIVWSSVFIIVTTAAGMLLFWKRDLK